MDYNQTLDYLFARLPMYQRIGAAAYKADLKNTIAICEVLGNPQNKLKCIHVAGTNGKGSTSHMLAAVLQTAGYKVGLYTSPHLIDFRERIKVNGKLIEKEYIVEFVEKNKLAFEKIDSSFFEWTVGLAFDYFVNGEIDVAVIEVGLGGRLDSTNVIHPLLSVITNISFDHINLLGDTLEKIAKEKAGIIKERIPIVVSEYQPEISSVFNTTAREKKCAIEFASKSYKILNQKTENKLLHISILNKKNNDTAEYELDSTGTFQLKNILGVLAAIKISIENGFIISEENIKEGLKNVSKLTGLQGRWQTLNEEPLIICDAGHNEEGIKEVIKNLEKYKYSKLHFILGMVNDKEITAILNLLPKDAIYYFTKASVPRALLETELKLQAEQCGLRGETFTNVKEAVVAAKNNFQANDLIFVGGSTFVVADALNDN